MSNLMSKIYIGYVESIVKGRFGQPTLDLRIRVPSIHGTDGTKGVKNQHLPIARPLLAPGTQINKAKFVEHLEHINKVFVVFESGNYNKPFYLGITNSAIHEIEDAINVLAAIATHNADPEAHADIRLEVEGKQDKLTAGDNITIDENNVISASGGGVRVELDNEGKISFADLKYITENISNTFFVDMNYADDDIGKIAIEYGTQVIAEVEVATFIKIYIDDYKVVITNLGNVNTYNSIDPQEQEKSDIKFSGIESVVVTAVKTY